MNLDEVTTAALVEGLKREIGKRLIKLRDLCGFWNESYMVSYHYCEGWLESSELKLAETTLKNRKEIKTLQDEINQLAAEIQKYEPPKIP